MNATGAVIRDFVDNHWPDDDIGGEYWYEGYEGDPTAPDLWDEVGAFLLDPVVEYDVSQFGEIRSAPKPGEKLQQRWDFSHFFELWYKTRAHDLITLVVKVPRDTVTKAELEGLVREMIDGTIHHDKWEVVSQGADTKEAGGG